jgi:peptidyl-prolyl cis-trans isomerase SurA
MSVSAYAERQPLDNIVAVVNDDVVLDSELKSELQLIKDQLRQRSATLPDDNVLSRQVLERLIMQRLQLALANRVGIQVDDATLNTTVRRIAEQNRLSLSEFRDTLEKDGYDYAQFREGLRKEITITRLQQQQIENQISVSPQEIDEFLTSQRTGETGREFLLGHILIAVPEAASPEQIQTARTKAEEIHRELENGADFANVATAQSDSQTALEGGSLGWRNQAQLPTLFADVVPKLAVGELSDIIQNPNGFHMVKLLDRRDGERRIVTQTHARHILIRTDEVVTRNDARLRLETLRDRILAGKDFAELARAHSSDKASASQGGDLGWVSPGMLVPAFEREMEALKPGEISVPFETPFGWHIVQVLERRQHDSTEETRRAQAAEAIRARKMEEATELWLRRLRDEAYVDIRLDA